MSEVKNGTDIFVFLAGDKVAHSTGHTLRLPSSERGTSNKDTGHLATYAPGRIDPEISTSGMVVYADIKQLVNAKMARLPVLLQLAEDDGSGNPDESKFYATGQFIITNLEIDAPDQDNVTYTATFKHYSGFTFSTTPGLFLQANVGVLMAAVFVTGGVPPYTYDWGGSDTDFILSGVSGEKTCEVEDSSTPAITGSITVTIPAT